MRDDDSSQDSVNDDDDKGPLATDEQHAALVMAVSTGPLWWRWTSPAVDLWMSVVAWIFSEPALTTDPIQWMKELWMEALERRHYDMARILVLSIKPEMSNKQTNKKAQLRQQKHKRVYFDERREQRKTLYF